MVAIAYSGHLVDGAQPSAGVEMLEVGVFQLDSLPPLAFPSHKTILAEYLRSLAPREAGVSRPALAGVLSGARPSPVRAPTQPRRKR